jgi:predicted DNA-binding protein YlxM (UPF0122 family)
MTGITTYLSIIILNVNELNSPIERHRIVDWIKKKQTQPFQTERKLQTYFLDKQRPKILNKIFTN